MMNPVKKSLATMLIAEVGSVHDGSMGNALKLIEAAAAAGADAVKFQTHIPEAESLFDAPSPSYFSDETRFEYFRRTGFSPQQWQKLAAHAAAHKLLFLSSPFSIEAVDLLESLGLPIYKIPSGEVTNIPLLERVARTGKPVLLSSGMSDWRELDAAIEALRGCGPLTLLQCSSQYPCAPEAVGLNILLEMRERYDLPVGFSDHTMGYAAAISAAALGATVIEKHFTFSRLMYGSDAKHSMEPSEFKILSAALRETWSMRRNPVDKNDISPYVEMKKVFQKSIVTARSIPVGTILTASDLAYKKPGDGIPAARYRQVIGREVKRHLPADHKFAESDFV